MTGTAADHQHEVERLRARVAELERALERAQGLVVETEDWAAHVLAEAQRRTYWLDRWHLDLDALMDRRAAERIRAGARAVRSVFRLARRLKRRYLA